ncbi:MAG: hypothetical protein COA42_00395 [Alteromonadaceae bacterium]|nr:MAG: hypothetical protein COA42_00395 [Alteromonadaceae bacterium]
MKFVAKFVRALVGLVVSILPPYIRMYVSESSRLVREIELNGVKMKYVCRSRGEYLSRAIEAFKEPDTIWWIDNTVKSGVFIDIGACVGTYGIYAAKKGNLSKVIAIEPSHASFHALNENVTENGLRGKFLTICSALGETRTVTTINLSSTQAGSSMHTVGDENADTNDVININQITPDFLTPWLDFSEDVHVKIDVDGMEEEILRAIGGLLVNKSFKSIAIEVTPESVDATVKALNDAGLTQLDCPHQKPESVNGYNLFFAR